MVFAFTSFAGGFPGWAFAFGLPYFRWGGVRSGRRNQNHGDLFLFEIIIIREGQWAGARWEIWAMVFGAGIKRVCDHFANVRVLMHRDNLGEAEEIELLRTWTSIVWKALWCSPASHKLPSPEQRIRSVPVPIPIPECGQTWGHGNQS